MKGGRGGWRERGRNGGSEELMKGERGMDKRKEEGMEAARDGWMN